MSFSCPIRPCYSIKRINIYGPFRKKDFQMLHSQGIPYNRREGGFELLNLALYSQTGGKSGTF